MNMPGMDHDAGLASMAEQGTGTVVIVLRLVLLLATAITAGTGLLRPAVTAVSRKTIVAAAVSAVVAAAAAQLAIPLVGASVGFAVAQLVLLLAVPVLLWWQPVVASCVGAALTVLLVAETAAQDGGVTLAADVVYTLAAVVLLGMTVLALTVRRTAWRFERRRLVAVSATAALVIAGAAHLAASGVAFDRRLYLTGFGFAGLIATVLPLAALLLVARVRQAAAVLVATGFAMWSTIAAFPVPGPLPEPGVANVAQAGGVPVLVTPQRPGLNLVHVPASAGPVSVSAPGGPTVRATTRPGAEGSWAVVNLPAGRSDLTLTRGGDESFVDVDTGNAPATTTGAALTGRAAANGAPAPAAPAPAAPSVSSAAVGPDGPECAGAALGALTAGERTPLAHCPSEALTPDDATALRAVVGFLAGRHAPVISVAGDSSPRSRQATQVVRDAATAARLPVTDQPTKQGALVVVSGWEPATKTLKAAAAAGQHEVSNAYGLYLAPWLLNAPIVNAVPSSSIPLRFDPRVHDALQFAVDLEHTFGGENPSTAAYQAWLGAQGRKPTEGLQIYASAQVNAMPMDMPMDMNAGSPYPGQWIPDGTIVPVTGVLPGSGSQ